MEFQINMSDLEFIIATFVAPAVTLTYFTIKKYLEHKEKYIIDSKGQKDRVTK